MDGMGSVEVRTEPLDALARLFYRLDTVVNVNTNQIVVVDGLLDARLLERVVRETVARHPILLSAPDASGTRIVRAAHHPVDVRFVCVRHDGPMDFSAPAFRQAIIALSESNPIHWDKTPPVQFFLMLGEAQGRSCVYMNASHAVADAKSDSMLIESIMRRYGELADRGEGVWLTPATPVRDFAPLQTIMPQEFFAGAKARRLLRSVVRSMVQLLRRDDGWTPRPRQRADAIEGAVRNDFYHELLPLPVDRALKRTAAEAACTLNTLFTAALVRTLEERTREQARGNRIRLTCAVSLRQLVDAPFKGDFRSYFVPCNLFIAKSQSARDLIAQIQRQVRQLKQDGVFDEIGKMETISPLLRWRPLRRLGLKLIEAVQGTNACYSNPGVIKEEFQFFGTPTLPVHSYIGFGCLIPPYDFILYTPQVNGRLYLNAVYRAAAFADFEQEFIVPFKGQLRTLCEQLARPDSFSSAEGRAALRLLEEAKRVNAPAPGSCDTAYLSNRIEVRK